MAKDHFKGTELCRFHLAGACSRGTACNFAHDESQLKAKPNFAKTRLCDMFLKTGRCTIGSSCSFAHGKEEMRKATAAESRKAKRMASKASTSSNFETTGEQSVFVPGQEAAAVVGTSPLWKDGAPVGGGVFYHEPASMAPGLWSDTGMAEMKFGSGSLAATTHFSERSMGVYSAATTYSSELSSSSGGYSYEEPEDDMSRILQEIHAYTCNADTEQLDITPGKVFHL